MRRSGVKREIDHRTVDRLGPLDWVQAARDALIEGGVHAIKVDLIANQLKITRGSFYWHFKSRADLLSAVLELWESQNTRPFEDVARNDGLEPMDKYVAMLDLWLEETSFDPRFDAAIRDWARGSRSVAQRVASTDQLRTGLFERVFSEMGFPANEAMIRARITYYHQIGYYTLHIQEPKARRRELLPLYLTVLVGELPVAAAKRAKR